MRDTEHGTAAEPSLDRFDLLVRVAGRRDEDFDHMCVEQDWLPTLSQPGYYYFNLG